MATIPPPYDPAWLQAEGMMGGRQQILPEPIETTRGRMTDLRTALTAFLPSPSEAVTTEELTLPGSIRVRVYRPTSQTKVKLPMGLYIHSGGWYAGDLEFEDHLCRNVVENTGLVIFSPEYRLAPEHPYPSGLDDVCATYEFMHRDGPRFGGDPKFKVIMGGSAGGNLAACVALKYVSDSELKPCGLIAACFLSCDPSALPQEYRNRYTPQFYDDSTVITNELVQQARDWYQAPAKDDPLYSPLLHTDIKLLPKTYIPACTKDPTHQETQFFYEQCKKSGVDVQNQEWVGWPHFFWIFPFIPESAAFMKAWNTQIEAMVTS